ncbi:hypothetical protein M9Y10_003147 [Tritrichomonas musculus]|uniref:Uncharacterized protein n=1 Tax=Tritrichomonas musculus TaxID=1915356 RepID=A0ABR2JPW0_9EUKA
MNMRIYVAGEDSIGRKALLQTYVTGTCDKGEYSSYLLEKLVKKVKIDNKDINVEIGIDEGGENIRYNRKFSYIFADVIIFCFCLVNPYSYSQIETEFYEDFIKYCKDKPYILVGLKKDKRENFKTSIENNYHEKGKIDRKKGERLKEKIKAEYYIECSSWEHENINEVFETAIKLFLNKNQNKNEDKNKLSTKHKKANSKAICNLY